MIHVIAHDDAKLIQPYVDFQWDAECLTVSCEVDYPSSEEPKMVLRDQLDRQFNIRRPSYVITAGRFSMALDCQQRIKDWDVFTYPEHWIECTFPFAQAVPAAVSIEASFDENGRSEMDEPSALYDAIRGTFYLSWGEVSIWYELAPALALGVASDSSLRQIRLDGLHVEIPEPRVKRRPKTFWHRFGL